jgi:hypothetical protein
MMESNLRLGQEEGYKYAFCYATNFKTGLALKRLHFDKIAGMNVRDFEAYGVLPFKKVDR